MKTKTFILGCMLLSFCSIADAKDIQLFNPDIFGQATTTSIKPLRQKQSDEISPISVLLDMQCGKYRAASVFYPKRVTFADAENTVKKYYDKYEKKFFPDIEMAVWRVEDRHFSISITKEDDRIRMSYLQHQPWSQLWIDIMKTKTMGAKTEILEELEENECKELKAP